ncbi:MAG TPA: Xaa-Pro peptidase family protein [Gemmatimonadales bacterium]|nr:Xaa-Pro peptidase family protein [Gemmatimonadales bacterium]
MSDRHRARQEAVRAQLATVDVEAFVVTTLANIRWLTGFTGSAAMLLLTRDRCRLITDFRYAVQAPSEVAEAADVLVERASVWGRLAELLDAGGWGRVGYEPHTLPARDARRLKRAVAGALIDGAEVVERLREVKDDGEVALIRAAGALAIDALAEAVATVRPGDRELDVAARLEAALRSRGSEWHPFETIVATGERSALPHARTSTKALRRGDLLLIDFGAKVEGYCSDITRMFVLGPADDRQRTIHGLVASAQRTAREGIRAGMSGRTADALARDIIVQGGHGEAFGHSLGHGIGLDVHEGPRLATTVDRPIPEGAVVTVEPGIYLPGWGGVRLEDDVWLTADGPVLLTDGRTALIELDF